MRHLQGLGSSDVKRDASTSGGLAGSIDPKEDILLLLI